MKFLHAADLHIDSQLRGLERYPGAPHERVRSATREAFTRVIDVALAEKVRFVVLAGDLFDTGWKDYNTGLFFLRELSRLRASGTQVIVIRGNHDFDLTRTLRWPDFVHELAIDGEIRRFEKDGIAFHGASYGERHVKASLLPKYAAPLTDLFNVGVLHTNATGDPAHDPYAPCSVQDLLDKGYDYWALGHVHQREILHRDALVVYPGNTQGRHARELGAKGVYVVEIDPHTQKAKEPVFHATDVMRWHRADVVLGEDDDEHDLLDKARERFGAIADQEDGLLAAVRLRVSGASRAHAAVVRKREKIVADLRGIAVEMQGAMWLEKVHLDTRPAAGIEALAEAKGLVGELLARGARLREAEPDLASIAAMLEPLRKKLGGELAEIGVDTTNPEWLEGLLAEAESRLAEELGGRGERR